MRKQVGVLAAAMGLVATGLVSAQLAAPAMPSDRNDKYIWLEDANGPRAMEWVKAHNATTAKVLEADPHFKSFDAEALTVLNDPAKIAFPDMRGADEIYNFWQDKDHVRGILRKTTRADYATEHPHWNTVIDYDALGKQDNVKWVSHGLNCLYPGEDLCLVTLSAGGEDASTLREFSLKQGKFVEGGFVLPHSKQNVSWVNEDTLLVARDWSADGSGKLADGTPTLTPSGYAYIVKRWKRGTPLASAVEVYRGQPTDEAASAYVEHDAQGDLLTLFHRQISFFEGQTFVGEPGALKQLAIPAKADLAGLLDGRAMIEVREDWTPAGQAKTFKAGSLLAVKLADLKRDPEHLKPEVVFAPTMDEFLEGSRTTRDRLLLTTLKHVQGRAYVYTPKGVMGWAVKSIPVPENLAVGIVDASETDNTFYVAETGFLTPTTLSMGDASAPEKPLTVAKTQPTEFDASKDAVEQLEATSKDGTKVPYFVVHPKGMKYDGANATLLNAYGGFEVPELPSYNGVRGKLWLEHGGVFVLANIRGGGEFGPAWHEAGLKMNRQRIYDDFAAVGEDLVARKITSPQHLGIIGGSNGGLLMGVEMEQHPTLWNAVVIQVPLLDMLRFEKIAAGASWVGEYGSVSVPAERAFLERISPYNQLRPATKYPEPLIFTTTKDDRVGPQHARKFAAKMEEFHEPFYYDEITEGGHSAGADLKEQARSNAETYVYLTRKLMESPAATTQGAAAGR